MKIKIGEREYETPFSYHPGCGGDPGTVVDAEDREFCIPEPCADEDDIGQFIVAALNSRVESEKGEMRVALESLISTLEPSVNYTGSMVVWSAEDRAATKEAIREAREVLKKYE